MIASVHIADVGLPRALGIFRRRPDSSKTPGLLWAETTFAAPLGGGIPTPQFGRAGLIAFWQDDRAFDGFLAAHPLAGAFANGWHVRLVPTRASGTWSRLPKLTCDEETMTDEEPVAVLTLGRLRLGQALRFLRANSPAAELAVNSPALLASTGLARPPLMSTFSLWQTVAAMRAYAYGHNDLGHLNAINTHRKKPLHHESIFIRMRPYAAQGKWDDCEPLSSTE